MADKVGSEQIETKNVAEAFAAYRESVDRATRASKRKEVDRKEYYSKLVVYIMRKQLFLIQMLAVGFVMMNLINYHQTNDSPWLNYVAPVIGLGLTLLLFPTTEEWEYKPWQAQAERQERTFFT